MTTMVPAYSRAWWERAPLELVRRDVAATRRTLTAAIVDSREFLLEQRRATRETLLPRGTRIAFTGGVDCIDHAAIWSALDRAHARHADMVLLHGGAPKGAERIAACWVDRRGVAQFLFRSDWNAMARPRHSSATTSCSRAYRPA